MTCYQTISHNIRDYLKQVERKEIECSPVIKMMLYRALIYFDNKVRERPFSYTVNFNFHGMDSHGDVVDPWGFGVNGKIYTDEKTGKVFTVDINLDTFTKKKKVEWAYTRNAADLKYLEFIKIFDVKEAEILL